MSAASIQSACTITSAGSGAVVTPSFALSGEVTGSGKGIPYSVGLGGSVSGANASAANLPVSWDFLLLGSAGSTLDYYLVFDGTIQDANGFFGGVTSSITGTALAGTEIMGSAVLNGFTSPASYTVTIRVANDGSSAFIGVGTPVVVTPEPSSMILLGSGLLSALVVLARRRSIPAAVR